MTEHPDYIAELWDAIEETAPDGAVFILGVYAPGDEQPYLLINVKSNSDLASALRNFARGVGGDA